MRVLSLFDGISVAKEALNQLQIPHYYYAVEIDKFAKKVGDTRFSDLNRSLGDDVTKIEYIPKIDLLIGGSPCQDLSSLNYRGKQLMGDKSSLLFDYASILKRAQMENPNVYFLLENVRPRKDTKQAIDQILGVKGVLINSSYFTPQNRLRCYWTNITQLKEMPRTISWNLEYNYYRHKSYKVNGVITGMTKLKTNNIPCLLAHDCGVSSRIVKVTKSIDITGKHYSEFTPISVDEYELAQGLPVGFTNCGISDAKRYGMLGNSFTLPVIKFILNKIR